MFYRANFVAVCPDLVFLTSNHKIYAAIYDIYITGLLSYYSQD